MKIGVLTFAQTTNYGAALQMYALQQVFIKKGVDCETINYAPKKITDKHLPTAVFKRKGLKLKMVAPFQYPVYKKRWQLFKEFEQKYIKLSKKYNKFELTTLEKDYDKLVVGSDQVWNLVLTGEDDTTYFLEFVNDKSKKCSYAASIGTEYFDENLAEKCEKMLSDFSNVSFRESQSAKRFVEKTKINATADIDPTLMLDRADWLKLIDKKPPVDEKYILLYLIPENSENLSKIKTIAKQMGCSIYCVRKGIKQLSGVNVINQLSPKDFLNYIYHSELVVAGSFHALCFSLIYGKQFLITETQGDAKRTSRLTDLLKKLNISDKFVGDAIDSAGNVKLNDVDYKSVYLSLNEMKNVSMKTIDNIINK